MSKHPTWDLDDKNSGWKRETASPKRLTKNMNTIKTERIPNAK